MQYGNVNNYFFCIFLWKNLEIQGFIIIFALAFDKQIAKTAAFKAALGDCYLRSSHKLKICGSPILLKTYNLGS